MNLELVGLQKLTKGHKGKKLTILLILKSSVKALQTTTIFTWTPRKQRNIDVSVPRRPSGSKLEHWYKFYNTT